MKPVQPVDLRSHRSLIDRDEIEFLTDIPAEAVPLLNPLIGEAEEFLDDGMQESLERLMRLQTAVRGKRAHLVAQVAVQDDRLTMSPESRVPPKKV